MCKCGLVLSALCAGVLACAADGPGVAALSARIRANPGDPALRRALGWALLEFHHDPSAAYPELRRAVDADPADLSGHKLLAMACARTGRLRCARDEYTLVLQRDPSDVWMWVNFADSLLAAHEFGSARDAYLQALRRQPGYAPAIQGLRDLEELRALQVSVALQNFTDSSSFTSAATTLSVGSALGDSTRISLAAARRSFTQGTAALVRHELNAELGFQVSPAVELRFTTLAIRDRATGDRLSGGLAATWSRRGGLLAMSGRVRSPIAPENIRAALLGISADRLVVGLDQSVYRSLSAQGTLDLSRYSDHNHRRFVFAQLSYRLPIRIAANIRLRYERLSFTTRSPSYFSPALFEVIRPQFDVTWPASRAFAFDVQAGAVFLPRASSFGRSLAAGTRFRIAHFTLRALCTGDSVPGVSPWSGRGLRIEGVSTF